MTSRFRWPIEACAILPVAPDAVWAVLSTPEHLTRFHPFVKYNPTDNWPGKNARDFVYYASGIVLERIVTRWDKSGIDLLVGKPGGQQSRAIWRLRPHGVDETELTIAIELNTLQWLPWPLRALPFYVAIMPSAQSYLEFVIKGLDFYLRTGQRVTSDQFGRHPLFSGKKNNRRA